MHIRLQMKPSILWRIRIEKHSFGSWGKKKNLSVLYTWLVTLWQAVYKNGRLIAMSEENFVLQDEYNWLILA